MDPIEAARQQTLILQCQLGSRLAMEELYLRFNQPLGYYLRRLLSCDDSKDVEQEVWLAVIRRIGRLRAPEAFVVWLYQIARSKAINRLADRHAHSCHSKNRTWRSRWTIPNRNSRWTMLPQSTAHCLSSVPRHREGAGIAVHGKPVVRADRREVIGCKVGTVRSRIHHAKLILRNHLEKEKVS